MTGLTDAEILTAAANYIESNGWAQYHFVEGRRACAYAAIHEYGRERTLAVCRKVEKITKLAVVTWNDLPHQTEANVVDVLRQAAAKEGAHA